MKHLLFLIVAFMLNTTVFAEKPGLSEIIANPPGRIIDMGSFNMHIHCQGEGHPVVVLDAGLGGFSMDWLKIQNELSESVMVCSYDRAGYGWSESGPSPRVTDQLVDELELLLDKAAIAPPYILVGHSFGGFNVQYFAKLNPKKVVGIALIEASHPDQSSRMPDIPANRERSFSSDRIMTTFDVSSLKKYPPEARHTAGSLLTSMKSIMTQRREFLYFNQSGFQVSQGGRLPDVPLIVLTRGKRVWPDDPYGNNLERIWQEMQIDLLSLTSDSWQVIAADSGHQIHLEQPDLVVESIQDLLGKICQKSLQDVNEIQSEPFNYCIKL